METNDLIEEWLLSYQNHNTRRKYGYSVRQFVAWWNREDLENVKAVDVLKYLDFQDWAQTTAHLHATAIRQFYRFHFGKQHSVNSVNVPKGNARVGRSLSWEKIERLISLQDPDTEIGVRNIALISFMVDTGLRAAEVCAVKLSNVDLSAMKCEVHGKGDTWNLVMFGTNTRSALLRWIDLRFSIARCPNLFCSLSLAYKYRGLALTKEGLQGCFKKWSAELGFRVSPHDMRRTMAVLMSEAGAPDRQIMLQGRWKSEKVFARYTQNVKLESGRRYLPTLVHHSDR